MRCRKFAFTVLACFSSVTIAIGNAADVRLESLKTPRGVTQKFILIVPEKPVAAVILFAGGGGELGLKNATEMSWGGDNFLVRSRDKFADHDLIVAVLDSPSDQRKRMNVKFRMSQEHGSDIEAVAAHLKRLRNVPVWLVGTSRGTFSAANGSIRAGNIDGLVLTATITHANPKWSIASGYPDGVASMALDKISMPTLIMSHEADGCFVTPPSGAAKLGRRLKNASKLEVVMLKGGFKPKDQPCEGLSNHGFYGIEDKAVNIIGSFIKANLR